jgi:hypothetical protein
VDVTSRSIHWRIILSERLLTSFLRRAAWGKDMEEGIKYVSHSLLFSRYLGNIIIKHLEIFLQPLKGINIHFVEKILMINF